ncbi:hypothetical protein [Oceanobacillus locisalsi]|uniref:Uncharacterized protein n=1 Tax=Oceanobacillus locisalsi TaxID=546107 RepID=A0ABW3NMJ3_9BACI
MAKEAFSVTFIVLILLLFANSTVSAEEKEPPFLEKANVDIKGDEDKHYEVQQDITIGNISSLEDEEIMHTLTNINDVQVDNLTFTSADDDLTYTVEEKDALDKYILDLTEFEGDTFNYQVSYTAQLDNEEFTVPLFVPEFGSIAEENIVDIHFEAPEEMVLQLNSFPVVKGNEGNSDTNYMMNIPSHVKYVFYTETKHFNLFNIIGWGSLVAFLLVVFVWIRGEVKKKKGAV